MMLHFVILVDLEDLGSAMAKGKASVSEEIAVKPSDRPEMVTPMQRKALTKEGYSIIGKKLFGGDSVFVLLGTGTDTFVTKQTIMNCVV